MNHPQILILSLLLLIWSTAPASAQQKEACVLNKTAPPMSTWHWVADTTIKVYFQQGMFTPEQQQALLETIENWNVIARETGTGVELVYTGETIKPLICDGCLTVAHGEIHKYDKKHNAFFYPVKWNETGLVLSAWIIFDVGIVQPKPLQSYMAHELGHGMGLWDCPKCGRRKSVMRAFPGLNKDNGLLVPSVCDQQVVKEVFERERKLASDRSKRSPQERTVNMGN